MTINLSDDEVSLLVDALADKLDFIGEMFEGEERDEMPLELRMSEEECDRRQDLVLTLIKRLRPSVVEETCKTKTEIAQSIEYLDPDSKI